jgi:PadR family transcriptional regulator PadR
MSLSITADLIRGHTDTIVLAQLKVKDSYGYEINRDIAEMTGGRYELKEATLYTAFRRMEQAGLIESYWGDEQIGARRRYYHITREGEEAYDRLLREWREAKALIEILIGEEKKDGQD